MPNRRYLLFLTLLGAGACSSYPGLLRPQTLAQLNPRVVALVNELPEVDRPNEEIIARLFPHGGLTHAVVGADSVMYASVRIPKNQYIWEPAVIVMERSGTLDVEFTNDDQALHMALMPSNGDRELLELPPGTRGHVRVKLDQPGLYWFGCPVSNHAGRGMLGLVIVSGEVPQQAKLDRPKERRP